MSYVQKNKLLNKQLPSYVGFFVFLFALVVTVFLSGNTFVFISRATIGSEPKNIQISNISDTSFTVSYTTDTNTVGTISYGTDPSTPNIALDDRDAQAGTSTEHQVHFITVKNLTPATKYYYVIDSGSQKSTNNGSPYEITTASPLTSQQPGQPVLSGTISIASGSASEESIIYASTSASQQLAALVNPDGSYQIPLTHLLDNTESTLAPLTPDTIVNLRVVSPAEQSTVQVLLSQADHVPPIMLSQNYDFTLGTTAQSSASANTTTGGPFPVLDTPMPVSSPEITSPTESQAFSDQQPVFAGRSLPNAEVDITIHSNKEIDVKLHSDSSGSWQYRPTMVLAPGRHTITIQSINASGILQTISRAFTVYASGSKFTEPSISPIQTTPSPTASPTAVPTPTVAPTATSTPAPTINTTPAPTSVPVPKTGSSAVVTGIVAGATAVGVGALLFTLSLL